jgi:pimeloyl-ACP methyl ester carboxylesterase
MTTSIIENLHGERLDISFHPAERRDTLLVLGHGLTGNKDRPLLIALAEGLSALGWPCMRVSFSGNGKSQGRFEDATISKEIGDLQAILETVPDWVRVAYAGHSMGSAVGVLTAAVDLRIRALISLAGMTHTAAFVEREFGSLTPGKDCMWEEADFPLSTAFVNDMKAVGSVLPAVPSVTQPWLLIHGSADDLVPVQDGKDAFDAAISPKKWLEIEGAGHSFDENDFPQIIEAVNDWLSIHFGEV